MQAGALISAGQHGCIFNKPVTCARRMKTLRRNRNNSSRKIYKVMTPYDTSVDVELANSIKLRNIPEFNNYFVLVDEVCESEELPEGWQGCSIFKPGAQRIATFMQLRMNYAGVRLMEYARNRPLFYLNWLRIQVHVCEGLRLLHGRNWIHGDLHHGNIVVDAEDNARIIDFGQTYNLGALSSKNINLTFLPEYDNYAPELDFIAGLKSGFSVDGVVNQIYTKKRILHKIDELFPSQQGLLGEMQQFAKFNDAVTDSEIIRYIRAYAKAGDIWTVGYNFFILYIDMLADSKFTNSEFYRRNHGMQMKVLRNMLQADPRKRSNVDNVLNDLYSMRMGWF
jgi:serine/threonine protein kinase